MRRIAIVTLSGLALASQACSTPGLTQDEYLHMLCVDVDGRAAEVRVDGEVLSEREHGLERQVDDIADAIRTAVESGGKRGVRFVIHGGLVDMDDAIESSQAAYAKMDGDLYTVFVNWETGMFTSYGDSLTHVRLGKREHWGGWLSSPAYFVAGLGGAIARLPITYPFQTWRAVQDTIGCGVERTVPPEWADRVVLLEEEYQRPGFVECTLSLVGRVIPGAARILTTPGLEWIGTPAYENMRRRAALLFARDRDYERAKRGESTAPTGALSLLMERLEPLYLKPEEGVDLRAELRALQHEARCEQVGLPGKRATTDTRERLEAMAAQLEDEFRIEVIAHSMGTLVANELVYRFPEAPFSHIVYMGAACTIQDFARTVLVYLEQNANTWFYNLTLHPEEEKNERYACGAVPHGSLLVWIDDYVTRQRTHLDRTLGRWDNIVAALPLLDVDRPLERFVVKGFGRSDATPNGHGEFNDARFPFWTEAWWKLPDPAAPEP